MNQCKACMPTALYYNIKFLSEDNLKHFSQIEKYLENGNLLIKAKDDVLTVREEAIAGLYDYFKDNMDPTNIVFRLDRKEWRPIEDSLVLLDSQWIDKVILEESVTFHIQPIVTADEAIYAHEMLARFTDDKGDNIGPYDVFQAAKKRNRTYALDRVCRMSAVRNAALIDTKAFINFIPTSIYSPEHCLRSTVELAEELGIESSRFVFEVVETEKIDDLGHLKNILTYYRKKGFQYALDDVGEGFSTIEVLKELAPYYMKLDMKYVRGISIDEDKQKVALKFLEAALSVDAVPLAEGVEDKEDFEWLKESGYQLFQGYYFGKPAPIK